MWYGIGFHGAGKNLAQIILDAVCPVPLTRVPQGHLFETDAITVIRGTDMKMAGHHNRYREANVPVFGAPRAAPDRKAGDPPETD